MCMTIRSVTIERMNLDALQKAIARSIDDNGDGRLTKAEIQQFRETPNASATFAVLLDISEGALEAHLDMFETQLDTSGHTPSARCGPVGYPTNPVQRNSQGALVMNQRCPQPTTLTRHPETGLITDPRLLE